ncbi:hypothetical protein GCM10027093_61030 [Paraburkholderia jirisanensis]
MVEDDDPLCLTFVPALIVLLYAAEKEKGAPLVESEVIAIRDEANCVCVPSSTAREVEINRGYADISPENCWEEWREFRASSTPDIE